MRDFGHTVSKGKQTLRRQLRHADAHGASGLHVLREPPDARRRQLPALPREPHAGGVRPHRHADHPEVPEEGLSAGGLAACTPARGGRRRRPTSSAAFRGRSSSGRRFYGIDVRDAGLGQPRRDERVPRRSARRPRSATLVLDVAKGAAAVGLACVRSCPRAAFGEPRTTWAMIVATMAAILGHSYSPYIGFKGGKGVATAAGALLVLTPLRRGRFCCSTWSCSSSRCFAMVSLGSVVVAVEYPLLCLVLLSGRLAAASASPSSPRRSSSGGTAPTSCASCGARSLRYPSSERGSAARNKGRS